MFRRWADALSYFAVYQRKTIIGFTLLLAISMALCLPRLEVDTSPANLVANVEGHREVEARFARLFDEGGTRLLIVFEGSEVLSDQALLAQLRLAEALTKLPSVASLQSLADLPFSVPGEDEPTPVVEKKEGSLFSSGLLSKYARREGESAEARAERLKEERLDEAFAKMPEGAPSRETWEAIAEADAQYYPDGLVSLLQRLKEQGMRPRSLRSRAEAGEPLDAQVLAQARESFDSLTALTPLLLSKDRSAASLAATLTDAASKNQDARLAAVDEIRAAIASSKLPEAYQVQVGGVPALHEEILKKVTADRKLLNPLMGIVCVLILGLTFRWWPAVVAPISAVLVTAVTTLGVLALLGQPLTILTNIITPLLLIVGLSDSVHLIGRYREELHHEKDRQKAGQKAVRAMMSACFLTSLTTAFGFASLATAKTPELRTFGLTAAFGVLGAYLATVFFVPAFITYCRLPPADKDHEGEAGYLERQIRKLTAWVIHHTKTIAVGSAILALGLSYGASKVKADARLLDAFESHEPIYQLTRLLEDKLSGVRPLEVMLETSGEARLLSPEVHRALRASEVWAAQTGDVIATTDFFTPLASLRARAAGHKELETAPFSSQAQLDALEDVVARSPLNRGYHQEAGEAGLPRSEAGRVTFYLRDIGVQQSIQFIDALRARLQQTLPPGVSYAFTGEGYIGSEGRSHVLRDLMGGLALALGTIFLLLVLLFRSVKFGPVAIPPNVIPLFATGAYMLARGMELQITTVITFSIGIGLAVDDTIHVVARFREEMKHTDDVETAILNAAAGTGRAIFVTAVSLCLGFAVLLCSEFVSVRQFAELICVTVINCLLAALIIQPALLMLSLGRKKKESA